MNDSRYNFAPTVEGLASQIYHAVKKTGIDSPNASISVRFPDATIDVLYRRNVVILVTFDPPSEDQSERENQSEENQSERENTIENTSKEDTNTKDQDNAPQWEVVTNKKHVREFYYFRNVSKAGFFDFDSIVSNLEQLQGQNNKWSHAYCKQENHIYEYHYSTLYTDFIASEAYVDQFNDWLKSKDIKKELYLFQDVSNWHTWKFINICNDFNDVASLIHKKHLEWSHVFEPKTGNLFDFRVKQDGKMFCALKDLTQPYLERFREFVYNREILDKIPNDVGIKMDNDLQACIIPKEIHLLEHSQAGSL